METFQIYHNKQFSSTITTGSMANLFNHLKEKEN